MKNSYLLPPYFKKIGWIMFLLFLVYSVLGLYFYDFYVIGFPVFALIDDGKWFTYSPQDIGDEIAVLGMVLSLLFISFAREKEEDEYIARIRGNSLVWAVLVNYIILITVTWLIYGGLYFQVMIYNMFTVLILFVIKFNLALYKMKKSSCDEE